MTLDKPRTRIDRRTCSSSPTRRGRSRWPASWAALETEVTEKTNNVLLESASFDFVSIRRTIASAQSAERGQHALQQGHPSGHGEARRGARRRTDAQHAGGIGLRRASSTATRRRYAPQVVELKMSEVRRLLGMDFPAAEAERILTALDFKVELAAKPSRRRRPRIAWTFRTGPPI